MSKIDRKDLAILNLLQKDSGTSIKEVARATDSNVATVYSRIKNLEKSGVIKKYIAILDGSKFNLNVVAIILCRLKFDSSQLRAKAVSEISFLPEVQEVYLVSMGKWDVLVKIRVEDLCSLKESEDRLKSIAEIERVSSFVVLETAKESNELRIL
jgi:DNA-binding Lrp family transcriptional regulator